MASQKGQTLAVAMPAEPVHLDGDAARLTQVFLNLLNNAVKYTSRGGHIALSATRTGDEVAIRIADSGVGLSPADTSKIFEMFYQGSNDPDGAQAGLGLGLALVKQLVELHDGSVEAQSAGLGQGSEFTVRLQALRAAAHAEALAVNTATPHATARRIFVVDDNRDAADSIAAMLRADGAIVTALYNGHDAVDAFARERPEIVFLDLGMHLLDGYQTARAIRSQPLGDNVVLIALTGWGGADVTRRAEDAGFDLHLVKPVAPGNLLAIIASTTQAGGKSGRDAVRAHAGSTR
jgi:CheY-like chemotaxis protein